MRRGAHVAAPATCHTPHATRHAGGPLPITLTAAAPLSAAQRQHLADRLLEERARVLRALNRRTRRAVRDDEASPSNRFSEHMADAGAETMMETLDAALSTRDTWTLGEIDRALRRLYRDPARFGLDEETGEPIAFEQLEIIPWARRAA
jgi:RNA polymerase-binding transcription factor DksA